jgi:single-strand selective monofunctional uracil DNA glycosylase
MEASGRNRTPDKLPAGERAALFAPCDAALRAIAAHLRPRHVIGVGAFAAARAARALDGAPYRIGTVPHPSPASPAANRGWARQAEAALAKLGIEPS